MTDETAAASGSLPSVRKYKGPTCEHPLMVNAVIACDKPAFAGALCNFIDQQMAADPNLTGVIVVDTLRVTAGTLCDMGWMLKD